MNENKFGLFIHWGFYSMLGLQEQALARYDLDKSEYEELAKSFDPVDFDADDIALMAKNAGMKYICFTAKHHDGFCMWNTKETDYNIMNTPFGRDPLKELADACARHGLLLSIYYSNPDWHHKNAYNPASSHQWKAYTDEPDLEKYKEFVRRQIKELLTGYGKIYTFFWDIPTGVYAPEMNELIRSLQPEIFINDRGWKDKGDFSTPEREYQSTEGKRFTRMTEANNSLGRQSWGYRKDEDFYSLRHIMGAIDRMMSMGGSYLLNVGPDARGRVTPEYRSRVEKIGDWYNRMQNCLEGHEEDTFDYKIPHANYIANRKNGKTYLHFYEGIFSTSVEIGAYPCIPKSVRLLNTGSELPFEKTVLPEFQNGKTGRAETEYLRIHGIPVDELSSEPIVIEIEF